MISQLLYSLKCVQMLLLTLTYNLSLGNPLLDNLTMWNWKLDWVSRLVVFGVELRIHFLMYVFFIPMLLATCLRILLLYIGPTKLQS